MCVEEHARVLCSAFVLKDVAVVSIAVKKRGGHPL